jgi:hypothetical protein
MSMWEKFLTLCTDKKQSGGSPEPKNLRQNNAPKNSFLVTYFLKLDPISQNFQDLPKLHYQLGTKASAMSL